jgi:hypothetical protein
MEVTLKREPVVGAGGAYVVNNSVSVTPSYNYKHSYAGEGYAGDGNPGGIQFCFKKTPLLLTVD